MKLKTILTFLLVAVVMVTRAQETEPFTLQGKISNVSDPRLLFFIESKSGLSETDTILLQPDGSFHYTTNKVTCPRRTSLQNRDIQVNDFFIAPGYQLTITGDGKDIFTLVKTTRIEGAESNRYKQLHDSIRIARMDMTSWSDLKGDSLLQYIRAEKHFTDSLEKVVFHDKETTDPYLGHFGRMTYLNNLFNRLYMLISSVINYGSLDEETAYAFAAEITDKAILDDLFDEEYMISDFYKTWFLDEYRRALEAKDARENPSRENSRFHQLEIINTKFRGKAKEFSLFRFMRDGLKYNVKTMEQLNEYKSAFAPYISNLTDPDYKQAIVNLFREKEEFLSATRVGQPAPDFTLESNTGETYSLADFRGKVVYIDLWSSWCRPCREEIPSLRELHEKYKNDHRIAIIGISVSDSFDRWQKALSEDKPEWLQLFDSDGAVDAAYEVHFIPKYILIDKNGHIVDMDAPRPSNIAALGNRLKEEMEK